ncbi:hypothetical protein ACFME5_003596 [Escherichia coli]
MKYEELNYMNNILIAYQILNLKKIIGLQFHIKSYCLFLGINKYKISIKQNKNIYHTNNKIKYFHFYSLKCNKKGGFPPPFVQNL